MVVRLRNRGRGSARELVPASEQRFPRWGRSAPGVAEGRLGIANWEIDLGHNTVHIWGFRTLLLNVFLTDSLTWRSTPPSVAAVTEGVQITTPFPFGESGGRGVLLAVIAASSQVPQQFIQSFLDASIRIAGAFEFNRVYSPEARFLGNRHRLGKVVPLLSSVRIEFQPLGVAYR